MEQVRIRLRYQSDACSMPASNHRAKLARTTVMSCPDSTARDLRTRLSGPAVSSGSWSPARQPVERPGQPGVAEVGLEPEGLDERAVEELVGQVVDRRRGRRRGDDRLAGGRVDGGDAGVEQKRADPVVQVLGPLLEDAGD